MEVCVERDIALLVAYECGLDVTTAELMIYTRYPLHENDKTSYLIEFRGNRVKLECKDRDGGYGPALFTAVRKLVAGNKQVNFQSIQGNKKEEFNN